MYLSEVGLKMDLMVTSKLEVWRVPKMIATFSKGEGGVFVEIDTKAKANN